MLLLGGAGDQPPRQLVQVHVQSYLEMAGPCLKVPRALSLAPATPGTTRASAANPAKSSREIALGAEAPVHVAGVSLQRI